MVLVPHRTIVKKTHRLAAAKTDLYTAGFRTGSDAERKADRTSVG